MQLLESNIKAEIPEDDYDMKQILTFKKEHQGIKKIWVESDYNRNEVYDVMVDYINKTSNNNDLKDIN